jgi:YebC/PmpR family DNA-binding regulatory protein
MAGHSKWANIKHRKSKQDAAKGKVFTKLIREITIAAKSGQDPNANSKLRLVIDKALTQNMTRDTIDRAIKRGSGEGADAHVEEIWYEGYAPGGVAVLVQCLSDNRNRTAGEVRHIFTKHGGNLGTNGSVSYLFRQCGIICFAPGVIYVVRYIYKVICYYVRRATTVLHECFFDIFKVNALAFQIFFCFFSCSF